MNKNINLYWIFWYMTVTVQVWVEELYKECQVEAPENR